MTHDAQSALLFARLQKVSTVPLVPTLPSVPHSPFVENLELDAFGLQDPLEPSVASVNTQLELLLELCQVKEMACHCVGVMHQAQSPWQQGQGSGSFAWR